MSTRSRLHIASSNLDLVAMSLTRAVDAGADREDVVAILLDTRDRVARDLAEAILEKAGGLDLEAEEARVLGRDKIPTAISILPVRLVELLFGQTHPGVSEGLRKVPPTGCLRVVVVAEGGATLMHLPVAAATPLGRS